jgi:hypothetical protein
MVRRTGRRDRGVRGIPGTVADRGVGKVRMGAGLGAGGASGIRGTRAGVRVRDEDLGLKGIIELGGTVLKIHMIY